MDNNNINIIENKYDIEYKLTLNKPMHNSKTIYAI